MIVITQGLYQWIFGLPKMCLACQGDSFKFPYVFFDVWGRKVIFYLMMQSPAKLIYDTIINEECLILGVLVYFCTKVSFWEP